MNTGWSPEESLPGCAELSDDRIQWTRAFAGTITSKAGGVGRVRFGEQWSQVDEPEVRPPAQNANPPPPFTW